MKARFPVFIAFALVFGLSGSTCVYARNLICDPRDFGALADGLTKDTRAIQAAIDQCAAAGNGTVRLVAGKFLSAPLFLKSRVTLQLDSGAILIGSHDVTDYQPMLGQPDTGRKILALINAVDAMDFAIVGQGTVDGDGEFWWQKYPEAGDRPRLLYFNRCKRIRVEGVTLKNSPSFHLVPANSEDVVIEGLTITAPADSPNTDGIDPSASRRVRITRCHIDVGDDNIAIKSGHPDPNHPGAAAADIQITDCYFAHGHGLSIGSETNGGVRNVTARRITFRDTDNGIRIKSPRGRGGEVSFIHYSNISMHNVKNAIVITGYYPERTIPPSGSDPGQRMTPTTPKFHHVTIRHLNAVGGKNAGKIVGLPESPLRHIVLESVRISADTGLMVRNAELHMTGTRIVPRKGAPVDLQENVRLW
ncbi:MAG: glycoside hydrolase family 28 protein [Acidobacteriia bacterium]|nr:glycoside hydrolase family 28 protein [Terriglobia bacterium]